MRRVPAGIAVALAAMILAGTAIPQEKQKGPWKLPGGEVKIATISEKDLELLTAGHRPPWKNNLGSIVAALLAGGVVVAPAFLFRRNTSKPSISAPTQAASIVVSVLVLFVALPMGFIGDGISSGLFRILIGGLFFASLSLLGFAYLTDQQQLQNGGQPVPAPRSHVKRFLWLWLGITCLFPIVFIHHVCGVFSNYRSGLFHIYFDILSGPIIDRPALHIFRHMIWFIVPCWIFAMCICLGLFFRRQAAPTRILASVPLRLLLWTLVSLSVLLAISLSLGIVESPTYSATVRREIIAGPGRGQSSTSGGGASTMGPIFFSTVFFSLPFVVLPFVWASASWITKRRRPPDDVFAD